MANESLRRAASMVQAGDRAGALGLIKQVLQIHPSEVNAWYLLSMAAPEPAQQISALERLLSIQPGHGPAQARLAKLRASAGPSERTPWDTGDQTGAGESQTPAREVQVDVAALRMTDRPILVQGRSVSAAFAEPVAAPVRRRSLWDADYDTDPLTPSDAGPGRPNDRQGLDARGDEPPDAVRQAIQGRSVTRDPGRSDPTPLELLARKQREAEAAEQAAKRKKRKPSDRVILAAGGAIALVLVGVLAVTVLIWVARPAPALVGLPAVSTTIPLTVVATAQPAAAATVAVPDYEVAFEPGPCPFELPRGAAVECGTVRVPEDRSGDLDKRIALAVAVYRSVRSDVSTPPLFYLQGGPGAEALDFAINVYPEVVAPIVQERDFVVFDQRGVGYSEPSLLCWAESEDVVESFRGCRSYFEEEGIHPAAYTTAANAADVADIARALRYGRIDLYGISYGTRLGLTVMRNHPQIVRAAVLDSAFPPEVRFLDYGSGLATEALRDLFAACAANEECADTYPDLAADYDTLLARTRDGQIELPLTDFWGDPIGSYTLNDGELVNYTMTSLHISELIPMLPLVIEALVTDQPELLGSYTSLLMLGDEEVIDGMYWSIMCHEDVYATGREQLRGLLAQDPRFVAWSNLRVLGGADQVYAACEALGAAAYDPATSAPVRTDIPTLVIAGSLDPTTPVEWGHIAAQASTRSTYVEFPNMGHGPSAGPTARCAQRIISQFLRDPGAALDTACVATDSVVDFLSPYEAPGIVEANSLATGVPQVIETPLSFADCIFCLRKAFGEDLSFVTTTVINGAQWYIYRHDNYEGYVLDVAVTEIPGGTLIAAMVSEPNEHETLYNTVFMDFLADVSGE